MACRPRARRSWQSSRRRRRKDGRNNGMINSGKVCQRECSIRPKEGRRGRCVSRVGSRTCGGGGGAQKMTAGTGGCSKKAGRKRRAPPGGAGATGGGGRRDAGAHTA